MSETLPDQRHLELECVLTPMEVAEASKRLAECHYKIDVVQEGLRTAKTKAKAELSLLEAMIKKQAALVKTEREMREVLCGVTYDFKKGEKTFSRLDTGEVARTEKITPAERQRELPT